MKEDHRFNPVQALLRWKERLYSSIIAKFEIDLLGTNENRRSITKI